MTNAMPGVRPADPALLVRPLRQAPRLDPASPHRRRSRPLAPRQARQGEAQARDRPDPRGPGRAGRLPHRHRARLRHRRRRDGAVVAARRPRRSTCWPGKLRRRLGHRRRQAAEAQGRDACSRRRYGELPDLAKVDFDTDVVFTWNGTTSGVRVPNGDWIAADREGLTICDATSAAFAQELDWAKLDVVTFSWQKVLGGEAAHGMLILVAARRRAAGELHAGLAAAEDLPPDQGRQARSRASSRARPSTRRRCCASRTGSTRSNWAKSIGGLKALIARADANPKVLADWVAKTPWVEFLAEDAGDALQHLGLPQGRRPGGDGARRRRAGGLRQERWSRRSRRKASAYDIGAYRDAPPGLRIWCGATVEAADVAALTPWLDWAFAKAKAALPKAA